MSTAIYSHTNYDVNIKEYTFRYTSLEPIFYGWKILNKEKENIHLKFINKISFSKINAIEQCKSIQLHYTESQLISRLEKESIGRPSTYTSILESIEKYVNKGKIETIVLQMTNYSLQPNENVIIDKIEKKIIEENKLSLTELGKKVTEFCYKYFDLFEYCYTKQMELFLDNVSMSTSTFVSNDWKVVLNDQIKKIKECSSYVIDEIKPQYKSLHCGLYKKYPLIIKDGPHGYYLDYKKEKTSLKQLNQQISEWIKDQEMNEERMKVLIDYMNNEKNMIINTDISIRKSKDDKGYYIFHKTSKMKKPKFYSFPNELMNETDYMNKIKEYIEKKYKLI